MTSALPSNASADTMPRKNTTPSCELLVQDTKCLLRLSVSMSRAYDL
jgi:hypothetical protein